jgi:hypothetical protein
MSDRDNITLPRKHINYAAHALEHFNKDAPNQLVFEIVHHLRAALDAPRPEPVRHPGYVIGNHWLETAYERICAGESEDAILEDYEVVREPRLRDLRRDAERYRRLLKWLIVTGLLTRERCRIDSPASYGDWWILRKPKVIDGSSLIGYGETEDAAIDAAMQEDKT